MATAKERGIRALVVVAFLVLVAITLSVVIGSFAAVDLAIPVDPERTRRELTMAWIGRILLVLALAWLVIGMIATRTSLVRRPGAAAARASWLGSTRPWRARESMLGLLPLDRTLLLVVPGGLLLATCVVSTSFLLPLPILLVVGAYALFAATAIIVVRPRSPWPVLTTMGGVIVPQCVLVLLGVSVAGPNAFWAALWALPVLRILVFTAALVLLVWMIVACGGAVNQQIGARRATATMLLASGTAISLPSLLVGIVGARRVGEAWNDPRVSLTLPEATMWLVVALGVGLVIAGIFVGPLRRASDPLDDELA